MREIILDARELVEKETAHTYLAELFEFPDYYGRNLLTQKNEIGNTIILTYLATILSSYFAIKKVKVIINGSEKNYDYTDKRKDAYIDVDLTSNDLNKVEVYAYNYNDVFSTDEETYFNRTEIIKNAILEKFPEINTSLLEQVVDDTYDKLF